MNNVYGPVDREGWNALKACRELMPWYLERKAYKLYSDTKQQYAEILQHYANKS